MVTDPGSVLAPTADPTGLRLTRLRRYPVKSCRGEDLDSCVVEPWGLQGDRRWMVVAAVWSLGVGVEIAQSQMGFGRQGDWHDALANSIGIFLAYVLWALARRFKPK